MKAASLRRRRFSCRFDWLLRTPAPRLHYTTPPPSSGVRNENGRGKMVSNFFKGQTSHFSFPPSPSHENGGHGTFKNSIPWDQSRKVFFSRFNSVRRSLNFEKQTNPIACSPSLYCHNSIAVPFQESVVLLCVSPYTTEGEPRLNA